MRGARRRRGCGCLVAGLLAALVLGWLLRGRLLTAVGGFLIVRDPLQRADAILVLSGGPAERVHEAADLHREGWAPRIVLTTPVVPPSQTALERAGARIPEEPDIARDVATALGVPPADVLRLPAPIDSTEAEARVAGAVARERGWKRLIVVTSTYHTRRVRRLFREVLGREGVEVLAVPSRYSDFRAGDWWRTRSEVRNLIVEYQKLVFYALPGHAR